MKFLMRKKIMQGVFLAAAFAFCCGLNAAAEYETETTEMTEKTAVLEEGSSETEEKEEDSELKEGQRKAAIQIISITGNEMTYFEIEETEDGPETSEEKETMDTEDQSEPDTEKNGILTEASETGRGTVGESGMTSGESPASAGKPGTTSGESPVSAEKPGMTSGESQGSTGESGMTSGESPASAEKPGTPSGESPVSAEKPGMTSGESQGSTGESGMTSGESQRGGREKGEAFNSGQTSGKELSGDFDPGQMGNRGMAVRVTRETKAVYIPVAVVVHTDLDEEMTFSILQAGDELEVLFEEVDGEEVITEIWMKSAEGEAE